MRCKCEGCFYAGKFNGYCANHRTDVDRNEKVYFGNPADRYPTRKLRNVLVVHSNPSTPE